MPTIRVANFSQHHFRGWKRTTVESNATVLGYSAYLGNAIKIGRPNGLDTMVADVWLELAPGQEDTLDLSQFVAANFVREPIPKDPLQHFGGAMRVNGMEMTWGDLQEDGAAYTVHMHGRIGRMFHVDVWFHYYPGQPAWCPGEVMVTASNPSVPDLTATVPPEGIRLSFGDAIVLVTGAGIDGKIVQGGTVFADGQARVVPVTFMWMRHARSPFHVLPAIVNSQQAVVAVGIDKLLADGNPTYPNAFDPKAWAADRLPDAVRRIHTWEPAVCGPASASGTAGEQEDSVFTRGEALLPNGLGAEIVTYLSALKMAGRPCHHLEADGSMLDPSRHTQRLVFWDGRPHWHTGVSPDRLGKTTGLTPEEAQGWWGPDVEHAMFATLAAATRLRGSPACQKLLRHQGIQYPLQWTTTPGWSNSDTFAARAVGWEGILAVHLWRELEDRSVAAAVRSHYVNRSAMVLVPKLGAKPHDIWDVRIDDPRLGSGARWIPWQQALGSYGADLAGAQFDLPQLRAIALRGARRVLADAWKVQGNRWTSCPSGLMAEPGGLGAPFDESFNHYGLPLVACVVLRHPAASVTEVERAKAKSILAQVRASAFQPKHTRWLAPGVQ